LPPLPEVAAATTLRGRVEVPPSWESDDWALELRSAERDRSNRRVKLERAQMTAEEGRPGWDRFTVDAATPGLYIARVPPFEGEEFIYHSGVASAEVEIRVPPPCAVEIVLVDHLTREPVNVGTLTLGPDFNSSGINEWCPTRIKFDPQSRSYRL